MTLRSPRPALLATVVLTGCGGSPAAPRADPTYVPLSVGAGPRYRPPVASPPRRAGLVCQARVGRRRGLHLELFAARHVVVVPAGIGVVGARGAGAYVAGGRCFLPLITVEPTGVVELGGAGRPLRLGDLFVLWGQPLSGRRLAGFGGRPVSAYVDGRLVPGDPARIRLRAHQEIVLEIGGYVPPHRSYTFAPGL